jgi:hypothetical protein
MVTPCLHLSRCLLHLTISLIDTDDGGHNQLLMSRQIREYVHVKLLYLEVLIFPRIVDAFVTITDDLIASTLDQVDVLQTRDRLDAIFLACCEDLPGALTIRISYHSYQRKIRYELCDRGYREEHIINRELRSLDLLPTSLSIHSMPSTIPASRHSEEVSGNIFSRVKYELDPFIGIKGYKAHSGCRCDNWV